MRGSNPRSLWALLPLAFGVLAAEAAGGASPQRCAVIGDDRSRLACYDEIFRASAAPVTGAASPAAASPPASAPVPASSAGPVVVAAAASPEANFGLTEAAKRARDPAQAKEAVQQSITATVAAVGRRPNGELVVTLENGQVWTQVTVDQRARVVAGDSVIIRKASLGSHLLVTEARYATGVRRVK